MGKFRLIAAVAFLLSFQPFVSGYAINPFPANEVLGPVGLVAIPQTVQQFIQSAGWGYVDGVNSSGQMAITASGPVQGMSAFVYLPTAAYGLPAGITQISYNPENMNTSWASAINDVGQVSGSDGDNWRVWDIGGETLTLSPQTGLAGFAQGINNSGQAIVQDATSSYVIHTYVWSPVAENGYIQGLTDLTPGGSYSNGLPEGVAINASGDALFYASATSTSETFQAYLNIGISHSDLSKGEITLSGTNWSMYQAVGLNDVDEVIGMATFVTNGISSNAPALWTPANGVANLNSLLPVNSGWVLQTVTGIDQLGDIEGTGLYNGVSTPFLLSVPEPSLAFAIASTVGLIAYRRRRTA